MVPMPRNTTYGALSWIDDLATEAIAPSAANSALSDPTAYARRRVTLTAISSAA